MAWVVVTTQAAARAAEGDRSISTQSRAGTQLRLSASREGRAAQQLPGKKLLGTTTEEQALPGSGQGATSSLLHSPALGTESVSCSAHGFGAGQQINSHVTGLMFQVNSSDQNWIWTEPFWLPRQAHGLFRTGSTHVTEHGKTKLSLDFALMTVD